MYVYACMRACIYVSLYVAMQWCKYVDIAVVVTVDIIVVVFGATVDSTNPRRRPQTQYSAC